MEGQQYEEQAYLFSLQCIEEERSQMCNDSLKGDADLFKALYTTKNDNLREILLACYVLRALQRQWSAVQEKLKRIPKKNVGSFMMLFVRVYRARVALVKGNILDMYTIESHLKGLELLLQQNRIWEEKVKQLELAFMKSEKILEDRIRGYRR
jgi:hypothetical protein